MALFLAVMLPSTGFADDVEGEQFFRKQVLPIFQARCVRCHSGDEPKGSLDLSVRATIVSGGESGAAIVPGKPDESLLLDYVSGDEPEMPLDDEPLSPDQLSVLRQWIAEGALWPKGVTIEASRPDANWWSLQPIRQPDVPALASNWIRTPIDAFILAKLQGLGLAPSDMADRRTLVRRVTYDLHGLPPTPQEVAAFVSDSSPQAYENLVERLLASPRYGERWARHWLDVVHYADTHGYDKDKRREHAWPYRDYVIRALNDDKPYRDFVYEQLAGDLLDSNTPHGIAATGFIVAGPWDFVGHVELREGTVDKQITRVLDRDDMVMNTMSTFTSLTVHCARCHDHKFDPITQEDYYSLQAVFAGIDRADRMVDVDAETSHRRNELETASQRLRSEQRALRKKFDEAAGPKLADIRGKLDKLTKQASGSERPEFGYHSHIEADQNTQKWVQVDLGASVPIKHIVYVGCHDNFNGIGAGFGFPLRYKIETSDDPDFESGATAVVDHTQSDVANPGVAPNTADAGGRAARFVRITATKLAPRQNDYIFALAELSVVGPDDENLASGGTVTALDSIEAPPRWQRINLIDGYTYGIQNTDQLAEIGKLRQRRSAILAAMKDTAIKKELDDVESRLAARESALDELPEPRPVFAAASHFSPQSNFKPTSGTPRAIHLLKRGSVKSPGAAMSPGTVSCIDSLQPRFTEIDTDDEGQRRVALARWIIDEHNPLTWRSIVNRIWHYHFGRGLVDTPNDFGRMGSVPTHPELLDWLAADFGDNGGSLKRLHRMLVTSAVYRQSSAHRDAAAQKDSGNQYLWRMQRRRLTAEEIRDAVLSISGRLRQEMYGPGFDLFGFKDDHSPHYDYAQSDPDDPRSVRRTVYRFIVRSVPDPFMETLDCADPSLIVPVRNTTVTALQALALLNNGFMVRQAELFAERTKRESNDVLSQIGTAFRLALCRAPTAEESRILAEYAHKHGLPSACRLIFNMNEFIFVD